jgi:type I restriction enzyme, S subunit
MNTQNIKNLSTYDNYKPGGIEFIDDIPKNWKIKRLKDVINLIQSGTTPKSSNQLNLS